MQPAAVSQFDSGVPDEPASSFDDAAQAQPELGSYRILRLVVSVGECNSAYNQFTLPVRDHYQTTICTFYKPTLPIVDDVTVLAGDGTVRTFLRNVKTALKQESFDIIHAHSPHVAVLFLMANLFRREYMARTIITAHNSYENFKPRNRLLLIPPFAFFRRVVCCGTAAAESFPWLYRQLAGRRLRAVTNGVNISRVRQCIDNNAETVERDELFRVVCVGRLIPIKCPLTVLEAFHRAAEHDARLTYLGEGNLRSDIEADVERLNAQSRVDLPGVIPRDDLFRYIHRSDLFVSASRGEGLPIAVLEAMACGCPVVLSDIPPHREIVAESDFIPLVAVDDVDGFSREIQRFQNMSRDERSRIGQQCQDLVQQRFSLEAMHAGYDRLYAEIVG